jgi:AcrR family transcriptional regulator
LQKISKRELILKVSTKHFAKYGYDGTILDNIAKECNLTKPAIYYYFKNKNSLYKEIICNFFTKIESQIYSKTTNQPPKEALKNYVKIFGEFFLQEPDFSAIFAKELAFDPSNIKECVSRLELILKRLWEILEEGRERGFFKKQNPFMIQLMIVSTLTNYHTTKSLREYVSKKNSNLQFEPELTDIAEDLADKILKGVEC